MQSSKQWLDSVKQDKEKLHKWLGSQWTAEIEAANRIKELADRVSDKAQKALLTKISKDETTHAKLLENLCNSRGIKSPIKSSGRYYSAVGLENLSNDQLFALGYHAESMRLTRIRAICADKDTDADIRLAFSTILKDEEMHEKAFGALASEKAIIQMKDKHSLGVQALGLVL